MIKRQSFFAGVTAAFIFLFASPAQAHDVIGRQVTQLSDTITMYTITYEFGFLNADLWMPMRAARTKTTSAVGYESSGNTSHAVVLSTAAIEDRMYYVPQGERAQFTLLVLEEHTGPTTKEVKNVRVTALPHIIKKDEERVQRRLTDEELVPFTTLKD